MIHYNLTEDEFMEVCRQMYLQGVVDEVDDHAFECPQGSAERVEDILHDIIDDVVGNV